MAAGQRILIDLLVLQARHLIVRNHHLLALRQSLRGVVLRRALLPRGAAAVLYSKGLGEVQGLAGRRRLLLLALAVFEALQHA